MMRAFYSVLTIFGLTFLVLVTLAVPASLRANPGAPCPAVANLPHFTIDDISDPVIPVVDKWQIFYGDVPISDSQLAQLAERDAMIDLTRDELKARGTRVYLGMIAAAGGTALSSLGWVFYGDKENSLSTPFKLSLAIGGILIGGAGLLFVTESIQTPLEPHMAPTPRHRLSREQVRELIAIVNNRLYRDICSAAVQAQKEQNESN